MRFTVRILGAEVLHVDTTEAEQQEAWRGDSTSYPVGFTGDWQADTEDQR